VVTGATVSAGVPTGLIVVDPSPSPSLGPATEYSVYVLPVATEIVPLAPVTCVCFAVPLKTAM